jgi:hypothetical protein
MKIAGSGSIGQRLGSGSVPKCHGSTTLILILRSNTLLASSLNLLITFSIHYFNLLGKGNVQLPGREVDTGAGNCLRLIPDT